MNASSPMPLRWSEQAEAEEVCALALVEHGQESAVVRPVEDPASASSAVRRPALLPWLLGWFTY
jgi:hypothetical protein